MVGESSASSAVIQLILDDRHSSSDDPTSDALAARPKEFLAPLEGLLLIAADVVANTELIESGELLLQGMGLVYRARPLS